MDNRDGHVLPRTAEFLLVALAILLILVANDSSIGDKSALVSFGVLGLLHGAYAFLSHGGPRLTATGVALLSYMLFAHFPVLLRAYSQPQWHVDQLMVWLFAYVVLSQLIISAFAINLRTQDKPTPWLSLSHRTVVRGMYWGVCLTIIAVGTAQLTGASSTGIFGAAAYVGVVLIAAAALLGGTKISGPRVAIAAFAFLIYVYFMFTGGGRLILGSLGVTMALLALIRAQSRWLKAGLIFLVPLALSLLAADRSERVATVQERSETGFESVTAPLASLFRIGEYFSSGVISETWGTSIWAALVVPIPRSLWPAKPNGLGYELVAMSNPDLAKRGLTDAILFPGEWIYNFGWLGLILMPIFMLVFLRILDRRIMEIMSVSTWTDLLRVSALAIASAGVLDLVWTGFSTYTGRAGIRLMVLVLVYVITAFFISKKNSPSETSPISEVRPNATATRASSETPSPP